MRMQPGETGGMENQMQHKGFMGTFGKWVRKSLCSTQKCSPPQQKDVAGGHVVLTAFGEVLCASGWAGAGCGCFEISLELLAILSHHSFTSFFGQQPFPPVQLGTSAW